MKLVVFDLDGTIIDSLYVWDILVEKYLEMNHIDFDGSIKEEVEDMNLEESSNYLVKKYGLDKKGQVVLKEIKALLRSYYEEVFQAKDHAIDYIKSLDDKGIDLVLASSLDYDLASLVLVRLGIEKYFQEIITEDRIKLSKRDGQFYKYIVERFGVEEDQIMVFEDALYAMKSAKKVGLKVVGVLDPYNNSHRLEIEKTCDRSISSFKEMEENL